MKPDDPAFLGVGWAFPPTFAVGGADLVTAAGVQDIEQSLQILLNTDAAERPFQDGFGCDLRQFMYEEIDRGLIGRITRLITDAILQHEARITLNGVDVDAAAGEAGLLTIRLDYTVRVTNSRYNMVFPFYLHESARSPA